MGMWTVKEVSRLTGVSVRALHHYDAALLKLQLKHMEGLISLACEIQSKGVDEMSFQAFHKSEMEQYAKEVKERWGATKAYGEYLEKSKGQTDRKQQELADRLMTLFVKIGGLRKRSPEDSIVQENIRGLQEFIIEHYYVCTDEILLGLGQMYVCDERMKQTIDKAGGEGTAEFVRQAIMAFGGQ